MAAIACVAAVASHYWMLASAASCGQEMMAVHAAVSGEAYRQSVASRKRSTSRGRLVACYTCLKDGGPILIPIAGCSFLLFIFVFERAICLRSGRVIPRPFVKRFIHQLREEELKQVDALQLCDENQSPVAEVFAAAVKKWGRPSVEVEQAVLDTGERVANRLRKYLRLFHGISTISPLLGLLGTVLGMINAFNAVATSDAMGRPELLAAGISEALITTASGLTVAIPAIIAHLYFVSRVDRLVMEIDGLGQDVVNAIASDGWREKSEKKPAKVVRAKAA